MFEIFDIIEKSNLNENEKKELKKLFLSASKKYLRYVEEGESVPEEFLLTFENTFFKGSAAFRQMGITYRTETYCPSSDIGGYHDPMAESTRSIFTVEKTYVTFPKTLLKSNTQALVETLKKAGEESQREAKEVQERQKQYSNLPRRNFARRNR